MLLYLFRCLLLQHLVFFLQLGKFLHDLFGIITPFHDFKVPLNDGEFVLKLANFCFQVLLEAAPSPA